MAPRGIQAVLEVQVASGLAKTAQKYPSLNRKHDRTTPRLWAMSGCGIGLDGQGLSLTMLGQKPGFQSRCKPLKTQGALIGFDAPQNHMNVVINSSTPTAVGRDVRDPDWKLIRASDIPPGLASG
jgi:hypothetical protein